jgi:hypothetical protein
MFTTLRIGSTYGCQSFPTVSKQLLHLLFNPFTLSMNTLPGLPHHPLLATLQNPIMTSASTPDMIATMQERNALLHIIIPSWCSSVTSKNKPNTYTSSIRLPPVIHSMLPHLNYQTICSFSCNPPSSLTFLALT